MAYVIGTRKDDCCSVLIMETNGQIFRYVLEIELTNRTIRTNRWISCTLVKNDSDFPGIKTWWVEIPWNKIVGILEDKFGRQRSSIHLCVC